MQTFDPNKVIEDGYQITYSSPTGDLYLLHSHDRQANRQRRIALAPDGWSGGFAAPEFTEKETVNRYGARRDGSKLPPFEGSLAVAVRAGDRPLAFTRRDFTRAWSPYEEGKITVVAREGNNAWTPVVLTSISEPPHETARRRTQRMQIGYRALKGVWFGKSRTYTGSAEVRDTSDSGLSPIVSLEWDTTQDLDVTFPDGRRLTFPRSSATGSLPPIVYFDLEPGMMGHPTDAPDGDTMFTLWPAFQGKMRGVELTPRKPSYWTLSGCTLRVTPRYLHPWR